MEEVFDNFIQINDEGNLSGGAIDSVIYTADTDDNGNLIIDTKGATEHLINERGVDDEEAFLLAIAARLALMQNDLPSLAYASNGRDKFYCFIVKFTDSFLSPPFCC